MHASRKDCGYHINDTDHSSVVRERDFLLFPIAACRTHIYGTAKSVGIGDRHRAGFTVDFDTREAVPPHIETHNHRDNCTVLEFDCTGEVRRGFDGDLQSARRLTRCDAFFKGFRGNRGDAFDGTEDIDECGHVVRTHV